MAYITVTSYRNRLKRERDLTHLGSCSNIEADVHRGVKGVGLDHLDITVLGDVVGNVDGVTVRVCLVYIHNLEDKSM